MIEPGCASGAYENSDRARIERLRTQVAARRDALAVYEALYAKRNAHAASLREFAKNLRLTVRDATRDGTERGRRDD